MSMQSEMSYSISDLKRECTLPTYPERSLKCDSQNKRKSYGDKSLLLCNTWHDIELITNYQHH